MSAELPTILSPEYTTAGTDQPILLYSGEMMIVQDTALRRGTGDLRYEWLPFPRVTLEFRSTEPNASLELKPSKLRIRAFDSDAESDLRLTRVPFAFPASMESARGVVDCMECGSTKGWARLRFHIPNLPGWLGDPVRNPQGGSALKRFSLPHGDWDVILDSIKFQSSEHQELKDSGGHGLTHFGVVARRDGAPFSLTDSEPLLECLSHFLSFCRGAWTRPILISGEDQTGKVIGRRWETRLVDRYKSTISWVPSTEPVSVALRTAFDGYADAWFGEPWGEALRLLTQWYVESSTGAVQKSIILLQAALELFAWVRLVEERKVLTDRDWKSKKNPFMTKLRILLDNCSIPLPVLPELSHLIVYCAANQVVDGPEAITSIRNALVHPSPAKRARLRENPGAIMEAWALASWYLDLCLLNVCRYKGRYSNRTLRNRWAGDEVEMVPWS